MSGETDLGDLRDYLDDILQMLTSIDGILTEIRDQQQGDS